MPYKRQGSPYWWASYIERRQRVRRSTATTDIAEAKALEAQWRAQAHKEQHWDVKAPRTFEEVMLEYLRGSSHLRSLETLKMQTSILRRYFGGLEVNQITGQDVRGYIRHRKAEGRANATINRELAALSSAINYCNRKWGWGMPNPVKGRLLREPHHRERYLTRAEVGRLITEACKLRQVPLNSVAIGVMRRRAAWRAAHAPGSQWVFARPGGGQVKSLRNGFEHAAEKAKLDDLRIHDLRHTAASWLVTDGVPLEVVKELLGHSSITMTEHYAHLAPHRVREAVNRLGHNPVTADSQVPRGEVVNIGEKLR